MTYEVYLAHHGVKGQRWHVRRYQNEDGTLTEAGKKRYLDKAEKVSSAYEKNQAKADKAANAKALQHPWIYSKKVVREKEAKALRTHKKAEKSYGEAAAFFRLSLSDLSKKGFTDGDVDRLFSLGKKFLDSYSFVDILVDNGMLDDGGLRSDADHLKNIINEEQERREREDNKKRYRFTNNGVE